MDVYRLVIDEELVSCMLDVVLDEDDYDDARRKINALICWHIDVATDPAVNGGYKLVKQPRGNKDVYTLINRKTGKTPNKKFATRAAARVYKASKNFMYDIVAPNGDVIR